MIRPSSQQMEVLRGLADDKSLRQIARALFLSPNTVKHHAALLYRTLKVHGQAGAVGEGFRRGLLQVNPDAPPEDS